MGMVRKLLDVGLKAPSHDHMREWHFIVIQDEAKRRALLEQTITPRSEEEAAEIVDRWGMPYEAYNQSKIITKIPIPNQQICKTLNK